MDLRAIANGPVLATVGASGTVLVAVGTNGSIFSSTDGLSWTARTNPFPSANLNATRYGGNYLAAGAGGAILLSSDAITGHNRPAD